MRYNNSTEEQKEKCIGSYHRTLKRERVLFNAMMGIAIAGIVGYSALNWMDYNRKKYAQENEIIPPVPSKLEIELEDADKNGEIDDKYVVKYEGQSYIFSVNNKGELTLMPSGE